MSPSSKVGAKANENYFHVGDLLWTRSYTCFEADVNILLNTGDVPNMYAADERADIIEKMQLVALSLPRGRQIDVQPLSMYNLFIERVRQNLHIVIAMSPIGDAFRNRLRQFPALVNCCTIDWCVAATCRFQKIGNTLHLLCPLNRFHPWPDDALEMVAHRELASVDLSAELLSSTVRLCKHFHSSARELSARFELELRRHNYVTPTSYLELISTFQALITRRRKEIGEQRDRYLGGLEKLAFAASQVSSMQEELTALQPKLVEASREADELMVRVQDETDLVEGQKELVGADEAALGRKTQATQAIKDECESDLREALPALDAAMTALNTLKPADITLVKSMKSPPNSIRLVLESLCVMRDIKPERKPDPSGSGKMIEDYWGPSLKMLSDIKFLEALKNYDKDNIAPPVRGRPIILSM